MWHHLIPVLIGTIGLVVYTTNLIELNRKKDDINDLRYVSTRRREIILWLIIFFAIMIDHIVPLWQTIVS